MIRLVLADLAKLRRPFMLWLSLGVVGMIVVTAAMSHESAALQWRTAKDNLSLLRTNPPPPEGYGLTTKDAKYRAAYRQDLADARRFIADTRRQGAMVAATQHPVGALGLALGHLCSLVGFLFLLLAAGAHVAGEWNLRTIKDVLVAEGRRTRFVLAKCISIGVVAVWFLLISWAALVAWGLVSQRLYPIPSSLSQAATFDWTVPRLEAALPVFIFASVLAVFFAVLIRGGLGTVLGGVVTLTVLVVATRSSAAERLSPAAWVASLMDFQRYPYLVDHVWAERSVAVSASSSVVGLAVASVVLAAAAVVVTKKRDVLT
jgi:hypothetical protein